MRENDNEEQVEVEVEEELFNSKIQHFLRRENNNKTKKRKRKRWRSIDRKQLQKNDSTTSSISLP